MVVEAVPHHHRLEGERKPCCQQRHEHTVRASDEGEGSGLKLKVRNVLMAKCRRSEGSAGSGSTVWSGPCGNFFRVLNRTSAQRSKILAGHDDGDDLFILYLVSLVTMLLYAIYEP